MIYTDFSNFIDVIHEFICPANSRAQCYYNMQDNCEFAFQSKGILNVNGIPCKQRINH